MRMAPLLFLIFIFTLIIFLTYFIYDRKEKRNASLVGYIENYFSSMLSPQINTKETYVWFTGLNAPVFNAVTHFSYTTHIGEHIDALLDIAPPQKPISFWIDELQNADNLVKELEARGFKKLVTCPFMTWPVTNINKPSAKIQRTTRFTFDMFNFINGSVSGLDSKTQQAYGQLLSHSSAENYLLYNDDTPIGTGTLFVTGDVGVILNIAILPEYQKRGFGSAISQFLMHRAYELNLKEVVLNANQIAIGMYQKLGFKKAYDLNIYAKI